MYSHICIVAPYLGTLAETHKGCGVGAKPTEGAWWNYPEDGRLGKWCLTNTDVALDPRQASKHYKPPTFKALNYIYVL
jgi:hypothetical protein